MLIYDKYKNLLVKYLSSDTISLIASYLDPRKCTHIKGIARDINGVYTILKLNNPQKHTRDLMASIGDISIPIILAIFERLRRYDLLEDEEFKTLLDLDLKISPYSPNYVSQNSFVSDSSTIDGDSDHNNNSSSGVIGRSDSPCSLAGLRLADGSHLTSTTTDITTAAAARLGTALGGNLAGPSAPVDHHVQAMLAQPLVPTYSTPVYNQHHQPQHAVSPAYGQAYASPSHPPPPSATAAQMAYQALPHATHSAATAANSAFGQPASGYAALSPAVAPAAVPTNSSTEQHQQQQQAAVDSQGGFIVDERNSDRLYQRSGAGPAKYDAFLIAANEDSAFVDELLHRVEVEWRMSVFLPKRNQLAGLTNHDNAIRMITHECRKVILILSPNFITSNMCAFATNIAISFRSAICEPVLIPIIIEKCQLPDILRMWSCLDYTEQIFRANFWPRVQKSIEIQRTSSSILSASTSMSSSAASSTPAVFQPPPAYTPRQGPVAASLPAVPRHISTQLPGSPRPPTPLYAPPTSATPTLPRSSSQILDDNLVRLQQERDIAAAAALLDTPPNAPPLSSSAQSSSSFCVVDDAIVSGMTSSEGMEAAAAAHSNSISVATPPTSLPSSSRPESSLMPRTTPSSASRQLQQTPETSTATRDSNSRVRKLFSRLKGAIK